MNYFLVGANSKSSRYRWTLFIHTELPNKSRQQVQWYIGKVRFFMYLLKAHHLSTVFSVLLCENLRQYMFINFVIVTCWETLNWKLHSSDLFNCYQKILVWTWFFYLVLLILMKLLEKHFLSWMLTIFRIHLMICTCSEKRKCTVIILDAKWFYCILFQTL